MILKGDGSQLEWRIKLFLSQDQVGIKEILNGEDIHSDNVQAFGLPTRLVAKTYLYRIIFADAFGDRGYKGPAYAYANDPSFMSTSTKPKYWEGVIDKFFTKYEGVKEHSLALIREGINTGRIVIPTGRWFPIEPRPNKWNGNIEWPRTNMLNYPVQGFAAEYMKQVRILLGQRHASFKWRKQCLLINTVHDDVQLDVDNIPEIVYNSSVLLENCFKDAPLRFEKYYGFKMNLPMGGDVKYGWCLYEPQMVKFSTKTFEEDICKLLSSRPEQK